ncbi:hypothetical protein SVAN01_04113 [Stagonosporopsis vannaccii]|nr:hypothetical protein SVAN01_04113 [Stagonosporopsis vannaccii]
MDDSHHAEGPAHKKPRRNSCNANSTGFPTPHYQQLAAMKQSQILTPPSTPPRSPRSSLPTIPAHKSVRSERLTSRVHFDLHMSIHRSTSTTLTIHSSMSESSLWTLPGFDDGDDQTETASISKAASAENRWSRLLRNAASSNRDRHRARLEGDGWAFVGGRYSDELQELSDESAESVDEEFDVVVLASESVGC